MNYLDFSERHQHFIYRSIIDINKKLIKYRRKVYIFHANATIFSILLLKNINKKCIIISREWNKE